MARRGKGEGSIYQRKDGRWEGAVTNGTTAKGNPKRIRIYGESRTEVAAQLADLLSAQGNGLLVKPEQTTLQQYLLQWLEFKAMQVRETTLENYTLVLNKHAISKLGRKKLQKVTPIDLQHLYTQMQVSGLSSRSVRYTHSLLNGAFKQALRWGLVARNPAEALMLPKKETYEPTVWTGEQALNFLAISRTEPGPYYTLFLLATVTGMRRGELLGLQWNDIGWSNCLIRVERSVAAVKGGRRINKPKTIKGKRKVYVSPDLLDVLKEHKAQQQLDRTKAGEFWQNSGFIFTNEIGEGLYPSTVSRVFKRLIKDTGLPSIRLHDLRHSYASLASLRGVPAKVLSERLGHASVSFTQQVYQHLYDEQHRAAALSIDELLGRSVSA